MNDKPVPGEVTFKNPKPGDQLDSDDGIIRVTFDEYGSVSVTKLSERKGSYFVQFWYLGKPEEDRLDYKTDNQSAPVYRLDTRQPVTKIRIITNPV